MTNEETLKRMKKEKLLGLIQEALININSISASAETVKKQQEQITGSHEEINGDEGILKKINAASAEIDEKLTSIRDAYVEIIGDEDSHGMKEDIEDLLNKLEEDKKKIDSFKGKIFGTVKTEDDGTKTAVTPGLSKELDDFFSNGKKTYDKLISDIETRLSPGATSVELATTFKEKVTEFQKSGNNWGIAFVVILSIFIIYFAVIVFNKTSATTLTEEWVQLLHRAPLIGLIVWLGVFIGNRRAENKKLEESYKHKEVMARTYTGYRKTIEELDDSDTTLLKKHMDNLLNCISDDSSRFLKTEGEQHPFNFFSMPSFLKNNSDNSKSV